MPPSTRYVLADLLDLMSRLRDPHTGCPWDLAQTCRSIAPSTIEEAYEVVDAIENGSTDQLREELGDLLFQVVFYAQLNDEQGSFDFADVVHGLTQKLLRRHPHVFPEGELHQSVRGHDDAPTPADIRLQWEVIKQQERESKGLNGVLDDVPLGLSALTRAQKLQKRASAVGFDWETQWEVLKVVRGELDELEEALALTEPDREAIAEEIGDVLFSVVNMARHVRIDGEAALRSANTKFARRFGYIEAQLKDAGQSFDDVGITELETLWVAAKAQGL